MLNFIREGGYPMFVILILGAVLLVAAGSFTWRPDPRRVEALKALTLALVFFIVSGVASCLAAVFHHVSDRQEWAHSPDRALIIMTGLAESMAPAILGFTILAAAWLLVAFGFRRLGKQL